MTLTAVALFDLGSKESRLFPKGKTEPLMDVKRG